MRTTRARLIRIKDKDEKDKAYKQKDDTYDDEIEDGGGTTTTRRWRQR